MNTMPTGRSEQAAPAYRSDTAVLAPQESHQAETPAANTQGLFRLAESFSTGSVAAASLLGATHPADTLRAWAAVRVAVGERLSPTELAMRLGDDIASIDDAISLQLDAILHHARFQQVESSWRGLFWLVKQAASADASSEGAGRVQVRMLNASKRELARDRSSAVEFDRSVLWRKVYEEEFGTAGGSPFGLLIADYQFSQHPDDVSLLTGLSEVSAASFAPLLAAPSPDLLGINSHADLNEFLDLKTFQSSPTFVKWRSLRQREESRFLGMPLPGVLGRLPYDGWIGKPEGTFAAERTFAKRGFRYREQVDGAGSGQRLWISGVWPFAAIVLREFGRTGWFADIRGASRNSDGGGLVEDLPVDGFDGFSETSAIRGPTQVFVTQDAQEQLEAAGLIPLCATGSDGRAVFHSNASLHEPEKFTSPAATANARISSMLQYVLCASRFAHYLKVIARDKVGSFAETAELERFLNEWVSAYVTPDDQASAEVRARLPLRAARVEVRQEPGSAGSYRVIMWLQPHFQIDQIDATLKLVTTILRPEIK